MMALAVLLMPFGQAARAQVLDPATPSKEYIRLGGRVIASESGNAISGRVTVGDAGLAGVAIALAGATTGSTVTGDDGYYAFTGLTGGGNYTVTPSKAGYTFSPASATINSLQGAQVADFTASGGATTYTIGGQVTLGGTGLAGVTMALTGTQTGSTTTNSGGSYSFASLAAGGNYTITPSKSGYSFSPTSATRSSLSANQTVNFTATAIYTITAQVLLGGSGLAGVEATVTGS